MDKLQPLIKHHYWICFGFALIFTVMGWFLASGALGEAITARETAVKASFSEAKSNADAPNSRWVEVAKQKNEADAASFKTASTQLRERQKSARQWPAKVSEKMKGISYQDQIKDQLTRELWASIYGTEIEEMLKIVRPFQVETGEGLVVVDSNRITHRPYRSWTTRPPESKEIWDAQEDIWLLRSLLNSINNVNGNAERITEAPVREIYRLTLRGGDRNATPAAPGAGGGMGAMGGMGGMGEMTGAAAGVGGGDAGAGMGGGGSIGSYPGKDFEGNAGGDILGEEFGADASAAASGGGGGGIMGGMPGKGGMGSMGMSEMGAMGMGAGGGDAGAGGGAAATEEKRYVDEIADSYKTRAFLLDVRVRDDKLPELLASLTDSDFPVEIVRVEIQTVSGSAPAAGGGGFGGTGDDLAGGGGMAPGMGAGMGAGMGSGMGMGAGMPMMGGGQMGGGLMSGAGMMGSGGMMSGAGMPGKGGPSGGMPGEMGMGGLSGAGGAGMGSMASSPSQRAQQMLGLAMSDSLLITVKIGGLMTLYQSAQEANAAEATEAASAAERATASPVTTPATDPTTTTPDPNAPAPDPNAPAPDPNAPAPDPNAPAPDPNAPAPDPGAPATDPNAAPQGTPGSGQN